MSCHRENARAPLIGAAATLSQHPKDLPQLAAKAGAILVEPRNHSKDPSTNTRPKEKIGVPPWKLIRSTSRGPQMSLKSSTNQDPTDRGTNLPRKRHWPCVKLSTVATIPNLLQDPTKRIKTEAKRSISKK